MGKVTAQTLPTHLPNINERITVESVIYSFGTVLLDLLSGKHIPPSHVPSDVMLPKHEKAPSTPQRPLSAMGEACSRMDLTTIYQILVITHYRDDEGTIKVLQLPVRRGVAGLYYLACLRCKGLGKKICLSTWARVGGLSTIVWLNDVGHQYCL